MSTPERLDTAKLREIARDMPWVGVGGKFLLSVVDEIDRLESENRRLRETLAEFATLPCVYPWACAMHPPKLRSVGCQARAALSPSSERTPQVEEVDRG